MKKKPVSPATTALAELEKAYENFSNVSTNSQKFKLKMQVVKSKYSEKMGANEEALFVQEADKLKREIQKAQDAIIKE